MIDMTDYYKRKDEERKKEFLGYLEKTIPYWEELSKEELKGLEDAYFDEKHCKKTSDNVFKSAMQAMNRGSLIDWGNDVDKARANAIDASLRLDHFIETLHKTHGYVPTQETKQNPRGR